MDSIYTILGNIYPAVRPGYEYLRQYYEKNKNLEKQLYYVERLLRFDSIAFNNYAYMSEEIVDKIDKSELIEQQRELHSQLNITKINSKKWFILGGVILILLLLEIFRRKIIIQKKNKEQTELHQYYQQKFDDLLSSKDPQYTEETKNDIEKEDLGIAEEVANTILNALKLFEEKQLFINEDMTATSLAKDFGTNANYLGRIVKHYHKKSFRTYLNDLRIDLALDRLRNDRSFKNYSIQAMAKEVGFKNAEPFSKSFKAKTGFYPSEFITKLEE